MYCSFNDVLIDILPACFCTKPVSFKNVQLLSRHLRPTRKSFAKRFGGCQYSLYERLLTKLKVNSHIEQKGGNYK